MDHPKQGFRLSTLCDGRFVLEYLAKIAEPRCWLRQRTDLAKKPRRSGAKRAKHGSPNPAQPATPSRRRLGNGSCTSDDRAFRPSYPRAAFFVP